MIVSHQHFDLNGKIVLERIVFKTPFVANREMQNEACLLYNIKGDIKLYSALDKEMLLENECILMKCGQYFTTHPPNINQIPSDVVVIHFYPDVLQLVFENNLPIYFLDSSATKNKPEINRIVVDTILQNYIQSLLFFFENPALVTDELVALKVKEVILLLLNTSSKEAKKIKVILGDIFNPTKASFKEIINAHCYDNLTTEQYALLCNMSLSTFKRRFGEIFGENPASYIRNNKLKKAARLLKTTNASVASICYDTGFSDTSNFTKIFRAYFKCTPIKYRNMKD
ncbi:helix-turn-helix transcriptional regulator [uncultured Croceitalea sp.]|uniref:helix-turn-helix transcriptional regulator n=1 Tax=uncultured Croceitalea sp. TaxID=1798908 RepID=UPI0033057D81